mmetsp:Transcript_8758/g.12911  ORF Transcript_8758/g.12911 Transcript_8758/m.12911 type:complete len:217 (-) Transcript_8758:233-883(-)
MGKCRQFFFHDIPFSMQLRCRMHLRVIRRQPFEEAAIRQNDGNIEVLQFILNQFPVIFRSDYIADKCFPRVNRIHVKSSSPLQTGPKSEQARILRNTCLCTIVVAVAQTIVRPIQMYGVNCVANILITIREQFNTIKSKRRLNCCCAGLLNSEMQEQSRLFSRFSHALHKISPTRSLWAHFVIDIIMYVIFFSHFGPSWSMLAALIIRTLIIRKTI